MAIYTIGCSIGATTTVEECLSYFKDKEEVFLDCETSGIDCHKHRIISLQLGDKENQFFIDTRRIHVLYFKELIESKLILGHNLKFDYKMLKAEGVVPERLYDTMLAELVLFCGYEKYGYKLSDLHKRYLGIELNKEDRLSFLSQGTKPFTERQIVYGCKDIENLGLIRDHQILKIKQYGLEYCVNLENEAIKALADIEYNGMILDAEEWTKVAKDHKVKLTSIQDKMDQIILTEPRLKKFNPGVVQGNLFGEKERPVKVNYNSPIQVRNICWALGYKVPNTNEREIKKLAKLDDDTSEVIRAKHPFFGLLLQSRETAKIVSTYGESFLHYINPATGRVHTSFWPCVSTGRVSSGFKDDNAPNLQNIPAKNVFRNCFKARPGFKWVSIDYNGQELRLMAEYSGEQGFIDVLNRGEDLHCYVGSMMFKRPIDKKKDKALRTKAKTINFCKPYGGGPPKVADLLDIPLEESEDLFKEYAKNFPLLNTYFEEQGKKAILNGYSVTAPPCRRVRWFPQAKEVKEMRKNVKRGDKTTWRNIMIIEGSIAREGGNQGVQGSGANMMKEALVEVRKLILDYNRRYKEEVAYLICTVHDAIDSEAREDVAEQFAKDKADIMIKVGNKYLSRVHMEVDVTNTLCWTK